MVTPISSPQASPAGEATKVAAPKAQPAQTNAAQQPADKLTLKSTGDVNHDGDSK